MNRNRKLRKQMMSGLAVGMAAVMGAAPVYAATGEDAAVSKEETVYVNANADGSEDQITVSNWLKNAGTEKNLQDESELKDIKNVKGDEEFTQSGNKLTWQTDGEDIYYQGTTTIDASEDAAEITTDPENYSAVVKAMEEKGYEILSDDLAMVPMTTTRLTDPDQLKLMGKLLDALEDNDDVQNVWHSLENEEDLPE